MRKHLVVMAGVALLAAACGETKLVAARQAPDETKVIDGPSLALPPDFDLRPPSKAEDYEAVLRAQKTVEARSVITGVSGTTVGAQPVAVSGSDSWLVNQAGTAQGDIREQIEREAAQAEEAEKSEGFWSRIMGKKSSTPDGE